MASAQIYERNCSTVPTPSIRLKFEIDVKDTYTGSDEVKVLNFLDPSPDAIEVKGHPKYSLAKFCARKCTELYYSKNKATYRTDLFHLLLRSGRAIDITPSILVNSKYSYRYHLFPSGLLYRHRVILNLLE